VLNGVLNGDAGEKARATRTRHGSKHLLRKGYASGCRLHGRQLSPPSKGSLDGTLNAREGRRSQLSVIKPALPTSQQNSHPKGGRSCEAVICR